MKVLILSKRRNLLHTVIEAEGHVVVGQLESPDKLAFTIAALAPHFVVVDKAVVIAGMLETTMPQFPTVQFVCVDFVGYHSGTLLRDLLRNAKLTQYVPTSLSVPEIILDQRYVRYFAEQPEECCVPTDILDEEADLRRLGDLFVTTCGQRVAFETRLACLRDAEEFEFAEIASEIVSTNIQAASHAREMAGRYLGVLASSVPGVETDCLPLPYDAVPGFRYIHYIASMETRYAVACVAAFGCHLDLFDEMIRMIDWQYTGQKTSAFTSTALQMAGLLSSLRRIVGAHSLVMSWLMDAFLPDPFTTADQRTLKMFCDFWLFGPGMSDPKMLRRFIGDLSAYQNQSPHFSATLSFQKFAHISSNHQKGHRQ